MEDVKTRLSPFSFLGISPEEAAQRLSHCHAAVGFDGFLDTITRPVRKASTDSEEPEYFDSVSSFGTYLAGHKQMNCSIELEVVSNRFGGNAPLLANALGTLGAKVDCIGTLGDPQLHSAFSQLHCTLHSFGEASRSLALEFQDGKIFLGQNTAVKSPVWQQVCEKVGTEKLIGILTNADLLALVNWSELLYSQPLWEETYAHCFADQPEDKKRFIFADLSDVARKSDEQVLSVLALLGRYAAKRYTVLSLNKNEALRVGGCMGTDGGLREIAQELLSRYGLDEIIIHTREENFLLAKDGSCCRAVTTQVAEPKVLTGAGDHFNAASCAGLLLKFPAQVRLKFASAFASHYIQAADITDF